MHVRIFGDMSNVKPNKYGINRNDTDSLNMVNGS